MPQSASTIRVISSERRSHPVALAVFMVAYLGLMGIVLSPLAQLWAPGPGPQPAAAAVSR